MRVWLSGIAHFPTLRLVMVAGTCALAAACTAKSVGTTAVRPAPAVSASAPAPAGIETVERSSGLTRIAKTYKSAKEWLAPGEPAYADSGMASWYGPRFHGRLTANGEVFDRTALSAAHPTLPLPSYVRVTNMENDRSIVVRVNDRGPYVGDRLIDVSERTAELLRFKRSGMAPVKVEFIGRAPAKPEDQETLVASYRGPEPGAELRPGVMLASIGDPSRGPKHAMAAKPLVLTPAASDHDVPSAPPARRRRAAVPTVAFAPTEPTTAELAAFDSGAGQSLTGQDEADQRILVAFQTAGELSR